MTTFLCGVCLLLGFGGGFLTRAYMARRPVKPVPIVGQHWRHVGIGEVLVVSTCSQMNGYGFQRTLSVKYKKGETFMGDATIEAFHEAGTLLLEAP